MNLTWHIFRKDLRRLKLPMALWLTTIVVRLLVQAVVCGLFGHPRLEWIGYVGDGPWTLVRDALDLVVVYLLAGWLVFEDSLRDRDAFWLTRPISGGRLLGAKLLAMGLLLVAAPVVLHVPWWLACGFHAGDLATAAGVKASILLFVMLTSACCAALTDGFPRYLLWSFGGVACFAILETAVGWVIGIGGVTGSSAGIYVTRMEMSLIGLGLIALAVLCHQYLTRRVWRSIVLLVVAVTVVCAAISRQTADWTKRFHDAPAFERPGDEAIQLQLKREPAYSPRTRTFVVPVALANLPSDSTAGVSLRAEWQWPDKTSTLFNGPSRGFPDQLTATRRLLGLGPVSEELRLPWGMRLSSMSDRMKREPSAVHVSADLLVYRGRTIASVPARSSTVRNGFGSFTISDVQREGDHLAVTFTSRQMALNLLKSAWSPFGGSGLFFPKEGKLVQGRNEGVGMALLDSTLVVSVRERFQLPAELASAEDAEYVLVSFAPDRTLRRTLDIEGFQLGKSVPLQSEVGTRR